MDDLILVRRSAQFRNICSALAIGFLLGMGLMVWMWQTHHFQVNVPQEAMRQAREVMEVEMKAACTNWFTDKKAAKLPPGRIVVCRAPDFLSNPLP